MLSVQVDKWTGRERVAAKLVRGQRIRQVAGARYRIPISDDAVPQRAALRSSVATMCSPPRNRTQNVRVSGCTIFILRAAVVHALFYVSPSLTHPTESPVRRPPGDGLAFAATSRCRWLPTGIEGSTCAGSLPVVRRLRSVSGKECRAACLATFPVCSAKNPSPLAHRARVLARLLSRASSPSIDRDHKGANFGTRSRPVLNLATSTSYRDDEDSQTPFEDAAPREKR